MINTVGLTDRLQLIQDLSKDKQADNNQPLSFTDLIKSKISDVNNLKIDADNITEDFVLGKSDNVHQVMIATEKAKIALELTTAIQNKVVGAYKEVMRIQL